MKRLLLIPFVLLCHHGLANEPIPEYALKATYLYNFAVFTDWPQDSSNTFNLCVLGQDNFGSALNKIEGKLINGRRVSLARLLTPRNIKSCHMLFLSEQAISNAPRIFDELSDAPVLTVTDSSTPSGAMITIFPEDKHLVFDINAEVARKAGLNISSKILRLAKKGRY